MSKDKSCRAMCRFNHANGVLGALSIVPRPGSGAPILGRALLMTCCVVLASVNCHRRQNIAASFEVLLAQHMFRPVGKSIDSSQRGWGDLSVGHFCSCHRNFTAVCDTPGRQIHHTAKPSRRIFVGTLHPCRARPDLDMSIRLSVYQISKYKEENERARLARRKQETAVSEVMRRRQEVSRTL